MRFSSSCSKLSTAIKIATLRELQCVFVLCDFAYSFYVYLYITKYLFVFSFIMIVLWSFHIAFGSVKDSLHMYQTIYKNITIGKS